MSGFDKERAKALIDEADRVSHHSNYEGLMVAMAAQLKAACEFIDGCIRSDNEMAALLETHSQEAFRINMDLARQVNEASADRDRLSRRVVELEEALRDSHRWLAHLVRHHGDYFNLGSMIQKLASLLPAKGGGK